ncbi:GNAT family N-acetyltransferase [Metabacillus mangrovi]|uniref:GNAT family N-acetyltransferase n=1 Tax=Metabacillus mangrovi TaxID=1491830 RepID=UPI0012BAC212
MKIKIIQAEETIPLRQQLLRPGRPQHESVYDTDSADTTLHLGARLDSKLISIATFSKEKSSFFSEPVQYRLRGMATLTEYRGIGSGSRLLKEANQLLIERSAGLWWCNARMSAANFYRKQGLSVIGGEFDIVGIGAHVVMYKSLK